MAARGTDASLRHGKFCDPGRGDRSRRLQQHGDVEMFLQQFARLDRLLITTINENDALALEAYKWNFRNRLGRGRKERGHLWAGGRRIGGPRSEERRVGKECRSRWGPGQ